MKLNSNGSVCVMNPKKEQHTDISTLTVAEAIKLGYGIYTPREHKKLLELKEAYEYNKETLQMLKEACKGDNTFFKNTNTSETSIGAVNSEI